MNRILISMTTLLSAAWPLLLDSLLKGATLLTLALVLAFALRKASAAARHVVWLGAMAGLLVLPILSGLLPGWRVLPAWTAPAPRPAPAASARGEVPEFSDPTPAVMPAPAGAPLLSGSVTARAIPHADLTLREWFPLVWLAGVSLLAMRMVAACWFQWRASRVCQPIDQGRIQDALDAARQQLGVQRSVQVLVDHRRPIPMVWGLFRPRLLLPAEALEWDEPQLRSVLLHELGHIRRGDVAVQWVIQIVCALHWFNPLVWFAAWRLHVERERACDDLVLASGVRASEYAAHLLHVATKLSPATWTGAGALAMARPSRLEGRLLAVLNQRLNRRGLTRALTLLVLGLGLCVLIPTAMLRTKAENEPGPSRGAPDVKPKAEASQDGTLILEMPDDQSLSLQGKPVSLSALKNEIEIRRRTSPDLKVVLRPAVEVAYDKVTKVLDVLKETGVTSVSLAGQTAKPEDGSLSRRRQAEQEQEYLSRLRQEESSLKAEVAQAKAKVDLLRADGQQATVAEVQLRQADAKLQRLAKLRSQALVSEEQLEQARAEVELLRAAAAERSAEQARADSRNRDVARAEVDVAVADLQITQANLRRIAELVQQKQAAQSQLDVAKAEVVKAEAKLRLAESQFRKFNPPKEEAIEQPRPNRLKTERLAQLLTDEIKVAEGQAKLAREQREAGNATLENYLQAELEVLSLKRQRAGLLGDSAQVKELMRQQIRALEDLEQRLREQSPVGTTSKADELRLRRQILSLQRQQAELE